MTRFHNKQEDSSFSLKELMTAAPTSGRVHAEIMRKKVQARRTAEDAMEEARRRRDPLFDM